MSPRQNSNAALSSVDSDFRQTAYNSQVRRRSGVIPQQSQKGIIYHSSPRWVLSGRQHGEIIHLFLPSN